MARNRTVKVVILGDSKDAQKSFKDLNKSAGKTGEQFSKTGSAVKTAMGVVAAGAVVMFGKEMAQLGARNEAILRRTDTVFGDSAATIKAWAADSASAFGLSETGVLNLASSFGDLLIPMGFTRAETAKMTQETLEAANALSEWTGGQVTTTQAAEAVSKAMLGEREMLKSLGISILEADVKQRLLEKGQQDLTDAALQQAKAIATQELVFEKSTDALNAYADGGDNALRSQKDLASQTAELKDDLAKTLAPALAGIVDGLGDMAEGARVIKDWFEDLDPTAKNLALAIGGISAALALVYANPVIAGLALVAGAVMLIGKNAKDTEDRVDAMKAAIEELGDSAVRDAILDLYDGSEIFRQSVEDLDVSLEDLIGAVQAGEGPFDAFIDNLYESNDAGGNGIVTIQALEKKVDDIASAYWSATAAIAVETRATDLAAAADQRAEQQMRRNQQASGDYQRATEDATGATGDLTGSMWDLEAATTEAEQSQIDLADAQRKAADPLFALRDAQDKYAAALATVNQLERDGKTATEEYEDAQWDLIEAQGDLNYENERMAATGDVAIDALIRTAKQAGLTDDEISDLVRQIGIYNATGVHSKVFQWLLQVSGDSPSKVTSGGLPMFDKGGVVPGPIGAPRVIVAHGGETVLPTHRGGSVPSTITVILEVDGKTLARAVELPLVERIRLKTGTVR